MSATESKGKGSGIGVILVLLVLMGLGVGAALLLTRSKKPTQQPAEETKAEEVVTPSTRLVEAPPPLPPKPPVVEEVPEEPPPVETPTDVPAKTKKKAAIPVGTIDVKAAQAVTKANYTKVRACYEKQLKVNHLLQGNVKVKITVFPDGSVNSVKFVQDTMHNQAMNQCIKGEIMSWKFPKPDGGKVEINQSYRLEPKAG